MKPIITMQVDARAAARGLNITIEEYLTMRRDGRLAVMHAVSYLACHGFEKIPRASYWLLRREGVIYKLRVLTDRLAFSDSSMKGVGRDFDLNAFLKNTQGFDQFLIFDAHLMPECGFFPLEKENVFRWMMEGKISQSAIASRKTIEMIITK